MNHAGLEFLQCVSGYDTSPIMCNDRDNCGHCHHMIVMAEVAREMIAEMMAAGRPDVIIGNPITVWAERQEARWRESKFFKLWQEEALAGRDPHKAFEERGWQP